MKIIYVCIALHTFSEEHQRPLGSHPFPNIFCSFFKIINLWRRVEPGCLFCLFIEVVYIVSNTSFRINNLEMYREGEGFLVWKLHFNFNLSSLFWGIYSAPVRSFLRTGSPLSLVVSYTPRMAELLKKDSIRDPYLCYNEWVVCIFIYIVIWHHHSVYKLCLNSLVRQNLV